MKAILVMEMPENCLVCPLLTGAEECIALDEDTNFGADTLSELINSCPLKWMPERKKLRAICSEYEDGVVGGWNACLDIIEGSKR